ncbi:hypothetical protein EWM64_g4053 [Hericium alpestre]|uniref:Uncharacterized protein n=1 Tax=Hericium alpestre TaxID=135208 RepID=A0A4Z0A265_9AGAM|nr:hypothetical protein EWM64_g4053 [Hericium alpestre]
MNRLSSGAGPLGVGMHEARHWHRRAYGGIGDITRMLPSEIGHAAGYEAYRSWIHRSPTFQIFDGDLERQKEALISLAIAEAAHLWEATGRGYDQYALQTASETAAATASLIFSQTVDLQMLGNDYYRARNATYPNAGDAHTRRAPQGDDEIVRVDGAETTFGDGPQPPTKKGDDEVVRVDGAETTYGDGPQPPTKKSKTHHALGAVNRALDKVSANIAREQEKKRGPSTVVEIGLNAAGKASNNPHASGAEYQGPNVLTTGSLQTQNKKTTISAVVKPALNDQKAKLLTHKTGVTCSPSMQAGASNVSEAAEQRDHLGEFMAQVRAGYPRWYQPPYRDGQDRGENSGGGRGEGSGQGDKAPQNTEDVRVVFWTEHRSRPRIVRACVGMGELRLADYPALMDYLGLDAETQWDWWLEGPQTWRSNMVVTDGFYVSLAMRTILGRVQLRNHDDGGRFQGVVGLMNFGEEVDRLRDGMYGIELEQDVEYIPDLDNAGQLCYDLS